MTDLRTGDSNTQFPAQPRVTPHLDYLTVRLPWRSAAVARGLWKTFIHHPTLVVRRDCPANLGGFDAYPDSFTSLNGSCTGGYEEREVACVRKGFKKKKEHQVRFFARFSGKYFDRLSIDDQYELVSCLYAAGFEITRIDFALDFDPVSCPWTFDDIKEAHARQWFSGFNTRSLCASGKRGEDDRATYYFGSRVSDKLLRVYSHGEVPRFELEVKGKCARTAWCAINAILQSRDSRREQIRQFRELIVGYVTGCIDFKDRSVIEQEREEGGKLKLRAAYRSTRLAWWQDVLNAAIAEPVKLVALVETVPSYTRTRDWIFRQVAKSLWMLSEFHKRTGIGDFNQVLKEFMRCKEERLTARDKQKLRQWIAERDMTCLKSAELVQVQD
jgi:hypothetical protein